MLSKELEVTLHNCFQMARFKRHEFMTVEHLLLGLLDDTDAIQVLTGLGVDLNLLKKDLTEFLEETMPKLSKSDDRDTQPTVGFQRVLQRAVFHVQSAGKKEVTSHNVLVAILGEQESQAVYFLNNQKFSCLRVLYYYVSHGISKVDNENNSEFASTSDDDPSTDTAVTNRIDLDATVPPPPKPSPAAPTSQPSPSKTTLPSWLTWVVTFLLTLGGLLLLVPSHWVGIGLILLTLILFLWKIFPPFLRWLSPETPRMVANIIVGITVGIVTTATTHYLWDAEPASLTGIIMAIVGWWLWKEHSSS